MTAKKAPFKLPVHVGNEPPVVGDKRIIWRVLDGRRRYLTHAYLRENECRFIAAAINEKVERDA